MAAITFKSVFSSALSKWLQFLLLSLALSGRVFAANDIKYQFELGASYMQLNDKKAVFSLDIPADRQLYETGLKIADRFTYGNTKLYAGFWLVSGRGDFSGEESEIYYPEVLLDFNLDDRALFTIGAASIKRGPGYIWNPSNPFADINENNADRAISYKRNGTPYMNLSRVFGNVTVNVAYGKNKSNFLISEKELDKMDVFSLSITGLFDRADATATIAAVRNKAFFSNSFSTTVTESLELHQEFSLSGLNNNYRPFFNKTDNNGAGFFNFNEEKDSVVRTGFLLGGQYTLQGTNIILEYMFNGDGYDNEDMKTLKNAVLFSSAGLNDANLTAAHRGFLQNTYLLPGMLRQNYLFFRIASATLGRRLDVNYFNRFCLDDNSSINGLLVKYKLNEQFYMILESSYFSGGKSSEAGLLHSNGRALGSLVVNY